jgi:ribonucleoside-diphosphate reductase alpha chain
MQDVLRRHRSGLEHVGGEAPAEILEAAHNSWNAALSGCEATGVRNSQATVIAPTGTISFMMDCDTTGIEPDLGLIKFKKLVGGGNLTIVNQTVGRALKRLGYSLPEIEDIETYILENSSTKGSPHLKAEHQAVFACSMGDNIIHHEGHIRMMAAAQPFISGAISKTVNLTEEATVEEVETLHMLSWKLGLKAVAIYRDNCKVGQPLSTMSESDSADLPTVITELQQTVAGLDLAPIREKLPRSRRSRTFSFRVSDCHGYMTVGEYENGRPGEIFLTVAKQGSTLAGIMDAFAISVSHGLQYGVPLRSYIEAFVNVRFEPAGITDDPELRLSTSLVDYIFRRLALEYLPPQERKDLGILSTQERLDPPLPGFEETLGAGNVQLSMDPETPKSVTRDPVGQRTNRSDAPLCHTCGDQMIRAGACYSCRSCGSTSGCG